MSAERGIIMSAESVRAIRERRKTQTRRVVKLNPAYIERWIGEAAPEDWQQFCPYPVGARLWVKETWRPALSADGEADPEAVDYRADGDGFPGKWRSPLFMPRCASRLTLKVTAVRVERLQDISEADAVAEGMEGEFIGEMGRIGGMTIILDARGRYAISWDRINGKKHPWASNPWVWVYEFAMAGEGA